MRGVTLAVTDGPSAPPLPVGRGGPDRGRPTTPSPQEPVQGSTGARGADLPDDGAGALKDEVVGPEVGCVVVAQEAAQPRRVAARQGEHDGCAVRGDPDLAEGDAVGRKVDAVFGRPTRVGEIADRVRPSPGHQDEHVAAVAPRQPVVAPAAVPPVTATCSAQTIGAAVADQDVVAAVARQSVVPGPAPELVAAEPASVSAPTVPELARSSSTTVEDQPVHTEPGRR